MSKLEDNIKKNKVSKDDKLDALLSSNEQVVAGLNTLATAITKLVDHKPTVPAPVEPDGGPQKTLADVPPENYDTTRPNDYVPPAFRKIVNEVLSPDFGIRVKDFEDRTDFMVDIIVPEQYSSLTPKEKESGVRDIRSRMIPRALGENGVRNWCIKIRDNLNKYYGAAGVQSPFSISGTASPSV